MEFRDFVLIIEKIGSSKNQQWMLNTKWNLMRSKYFHDLKVSPHRFIFSSQGLQCTYRLLLVLSNQLRINKVMFCGKFRWSPADRAGDLSLRKKKKKRQNWQRNILMLK